MIRIRATGSLWLLPLRVTPRGGTDSILPYTDGDEAIRIKVSSPPEGGKANQAVIQLLAKTLGIPKSRLSLESGETARHKVIGIAQPASEKQAKAELLHLQEALAHVLNANPSDCLSLPV